jgi:hypothetical protein
MKLHSPAFEKTLRRGVKRAVRNSPRLKRERAQGRLAERAQISPTLFRIVVAVVLPAGIWWVGSTTDQPGTALAFITIWSFAFIFMRAQALLSHLYSSSDLAFFRLLPISETTVFRWEMQKFFRSSIPLLLDLFLGFGTLAVVLEFPLIKSLAIIPAAAVAWAVVLSISILGVSFFPAFPYGLISAGFWALLVVLFFAYKVFGNKILEPLASLAPGLNSILPTGWPPLLFQMLARKLSWWHLLPLIPIAGLLTTWKGSVRRLQRNYRFVEVTIPEASDAVQEDWMDDEDLPDAADAREGIRLGPTAVMEIIQSRKFLALPSWHKKGFMEKCLWNWFTPREKALAEFAFPGGVTLTGGWRKILRNLAILIVLWLVAGIALPPARVWIVGGGLFITFCQTLACLFISGNAFTAYASAGVSSPIYAGYAIGFRELSRLLFKLAALQIPFASLFAMVASYLVCREIPMPLSFSLLFGFKAGLLLLAARVVLLTFSFSAGTNDSSGLSIWPVLLLIAMVFGVVGFAGFALVGLFVPHQLVATGCVIGAFLDAYALLRFYGWLYHTNRFDLLRPAQP